MPPLMTNRTQERLRSAISLVAKKMKWRPMMIFGTIGTAYLAFVPGMPWFNVIRLQPSGQNSGLTNEVGGTLAAMPANKKEGFVAALIDTPSNFPLFFKLTFFARIIWPLKGFFCHEQLPILR